MYRDLENGEVQIKLTPAQSRALDALQAYKGIYATDVNRSALDQLAKKGLAVKHRHGVTYTITPAGEAWKSPKNSC